MTIFFIWSICLNRIRNQNGVLVVAGPLKSQSIRAVIRKDEQSLRWEILGNPSTREQNVSALSFKHCLLSIAILY